MPTTLDNYRAELATALHWQAQGRTHVAANVAGAALAAGRATVPIAEYIAMWRAGIAAMEAGADQEQYNY